MYISTSVSYLQEQVLQKGRKGSSHILAKNPLYIYWIRVSSVIGGNQGEHLSESEFTWQHSVFWPTFFNLCLFFFFFLEY